PRDPGPRSKIVVVVRIIFRLRQLRIRQKGSRHSLIFIAHTGGQRQARKRSPLIIDKSGPVVGRDEKSSGPKALGISRVIVYEIAVRRSQAIDRVIIVRQKAAERSVIVVPNSVV